MVTGGYRVIEAFKDAITAMSINVFPLPASGRGLGG